MSRILIALTSGFLAIKFAWLMYAKGRRWALYGFCLAMTLIAASIAIQAGWAGLARHLSGPEIDYNPFLDSHRWLVNIITSGIFVVGVFLFDLETQEITKPKTWMVYAAIIALSAVLAIL